MPASSLKTEAHFYEGVLHNFKTCITFKEEKGEEKKKGKL